MKTRIASILLSAVFVTSCQNDRQEAIATAAGLAAINSVTTTLDQGKKLDSKAVFHALAEATAAGTAAASGTAVPPVASTIAPAAP